MCNLYSITRSQEAMHRLFRVKRDLTGNLPSLPAVFPDTMAPIVRTAPDGVRELTMMRWGFPPPPNLGSAPVTNCAICNRPFGADGRYRGRGVERAEFSRRVLFRLRSTVSSGAQNLRARPQVTHCRHERDW
jgi:putative SOS response-associated peptidase YedK